jgi:hypothetical protein
MNEKTYILKIDLPGGYTKGEKVIKVKSGGAGYMWEKNYYPCLWDPEVETKFFTEVVTPKYTIGQLVWFDDNIMKGSYSRGIIDKIETLMVKDKVQYSIKVGCTGGISFVKRTEEKIKPAETYFFISSRGQIHQEYTIPFAKLNKDEVFRQLVGNYFKTKEEAMSTLDSILGGKTKLCNPNDLICGEGDNYKTDDKTLLAIMLRSGMPAAIEHLKEATGISVRECKKRCDKILDNSNATPLEKQLYYIKSLVRDGKKLNAVKEVRDLTGWELRKSKDYVDKL